MKIDKVIERRVDMRLVNQLERMRIKSHGKQQLSYKSETTYREETLPKLGKVRIATTTTTTEEIVK